MTKPLWLTVTVIGAVLLAPPAIAQTIVTSFAPSTNVTPKVWFENDVRPGGSASIVDLTGEGGDLEFSQPLPKGAAKLTTDFTNAAKAEVAVLDTYGKPQDIFSTISLAYSYYKATNAGNNTFAAPSIKLTFFNSVCDDPASAGDCFFTLIYEPYWNGSNGPGVVTAPPLDTWTSVAIDDTTGVFWTSGGFGLANGAGGPPFYTLAGALAAASSDFADSDLLAVSMGVGTFNQGQIDYFDDVSIDISGTGYSESYDFEPPGPSLACQGFEPPMNLAYLPPAVGGGLIARKVKRNRVLPFKATLVDGDGNIVTDLVSPPVIQVVYQAVPMGAVVDVTADALVNGKGTDGNQFELAGDRWQFNLRTKNYSAAGTYTGTMVSGDVTEYVVDPTCEGVFVIE